MFHINKVAINLNRKVEAVLFRQKKEYVHIKKTISAELKTYAPSWNDEIQMEYKEKLMEMVTAEKLIGNKAYFAFDNSYFFIKSLELPWMNKKELAEAVKWEIDPFTSSDVKDLTIDYTITGNYLSKDTKYVSILAVAIPTKLSYELTKIVRESGLKPMALEPEMITILRYFFSGYIDYKNTLFCFNKNGSGQMFYKNKDTGKIIFRNIGTSSALSVELDYFCEYLKNTGNRIERIVLAGDSIEGHPGEKLERSHVPGNIIMDYMEASPICLGLALRGVVKWK
ncbi:hypothetical protein GGQ84_001933 [Desulfitispora alkaliphila]|uniref:type IV pilus biogenesis protein PilM n=1 Tax=Desulfitispora alkaliphila TaxID=622674 RepID=UPI003D224709